MLLSPLGMKVSHKARGLRIDGQHQGNPLHRAVLASGRKLEALILFKGLRCTLMPS